MNLDNNSKNLINLLIASGYLAYAVGGCVRDALMGVTPKDVDITTSAKPDEIISVLASNNIKYVETGLKHGTVTAVVDHIPYEITTFRCDGEYLDNRHPDSVSFVDDIRLDLARRDFTMNAIAYNDHSGIVDYYNGINDINNKIIRAVGDADTRFKEDALRIMRALRFSATLGFSIEESTKKAIFDNKELLNNIAVERVFVELKKLLLGDYCENVLMEYKDIFATIIPEIMPSFDCTQNTKWHIYDVYEHIVKSVAISPKVDYIRLALLLHDIGKPHCKTTDSDGVDHFFGHPQISANLTKDILKRFKASNDLYSKVTTLVLIHDDKISNDPYVIKKYLNSYGYQLLCDFVDVKLADLKTHNLKYTSDSISRLTDLKKTILDVANSNEPYLLSHLAINGNDLVEMGYKGAEIKEKLDFLLDYVMKNPNCNTKSKLLTLL